jgi:hypothetical protein
MAFSQMSLKGESLIAIQLIIQVEGQLVAKMLT